MKPPFCALLLALLFVTAGRGECTESKPSSSPLERAKEQLLTNKPADALLVLSSFSPSHAELSAYHYAYARGLMGVKKYYESIEHYRLAYLYADETADQERLLIERADVYSAMGYYPEAAVTYALFLRRYAKSGYAERAELGAASALFRGKEYREALSHYEKAGTSSRAVMGKANALQAVGRTAEARRLYQALIEHEPRTVNASQETLYWIGENFFQAGQLKDARVYFELVKDQELRPKAALGLGRIAMEEKNYEAAIMQLRIAMSDRDRAVQQEAILKCADAQLRSGKSSEARAALEDLRRKFPYGAPADQAALLLAQLLRREDKLPESAAMLKPLIFRRKPVPAALDQLEAMIVEAKDRDPKGFVKLWSEAGNWMLDPARAGTIVQIAKALRHEGRSFLDVCTWLIKSGPEDAKSEARLLMARFYADMGDAATAWSYLKRAKVKNRSDEVARLKAAIYLANNDTLNASEMLLTLHHPDRDDLLLLLNMTGALKHRDKAIAFCERIVRKGVSPEIMTRFADVVYAAGNRPKALEYYRAALAIPSKPTGTAGGSSGDREWAHYRIASIVGSSSGIEDLRAIGAGKSPVGRFASAELRAMDLPRTAK